MSEIKLNINGREVAGFDGQTVLEIARDNGIDIPTLCHDERAKMYGSCGICVVEAENSPKLLRSCSTYAADGMVIMTDTERVRASRQTALELLLSDHSGDCRPPCVLACPAQTDCQGYVGLIANGQYGQALKLVKDKIPLPAAIGRVCPHPCEEACRRQLVEEPISIAALKQYVGDLDLQSGEVYTQETPPSTGRRVAVIGGGPGGLTAAYFLRTMGHEVAVYDMMPHMGGMLRYGIPEYRLPKKLLSEEIDAIRDMGVTFHNNIKIGKDITLDYLRDAFDAVIVAVGAWTSSGLRCPGEELEGVLGGIDFLQDVALGKAVLTGRRIAVVGGGNTAMDACRTSIRLGAEKVYNIYRRTRAEMPAEEIEIAEAEEEGVIFKNLTNPIEVVGDNGKVKSVRLQIMELGEPDASGRRAPVPVEGAEETLEIDTIIVAIGQKLDPVGLEGIEQTKWHTISADESTFRTSLEGVFAIGDATNNGADIAITAIGEAKKAAVMVDKYLSGEELGYEEPYLVKREMTAEDFAHEKKEARAKMPHRPAEERRDDFLEINLGLSEEEARREASRCLECGCMDYFECKLIDLANRYKVQPAKYDGQVHHREPQDDHPFIHRNPDKCILCGLCVRVCDEVVGATALGLVDRGFNTIVKPALDVKLQETDCISCGQCVAVCPTGALTETQMIPKQVPLREMTTDTVCSFCSVGCKTKLTAAGGQLLRSLPTADIGKDALLCMKGRFGFGEIANGGRISTSLVRTGAELRETTLQQAVVYTNKKLQSLQTQYGRDSIAVAVSDRYTNEEAFLIREYATKAFGLDDVYSLNRLESGLADVLGADKSTATFGELENTGLILLVGADLMHNHPVAGMKIRRAVENGAKLVILGGAEGLLDDIACLRLEMEDLGLLGQIAKALLDSGDKTVDGAKELEKALKAVKVSEDAVKVAELYKDAKKSVIVFEKNSVTADTARLIGDIAVLGGHATAPRDGILQLLPGSNAQGLADLGIAPGEMLREKVASGQVKGLFVFGEDVQDMELDRLEFLAVQELHMTETAKKADAVLPASSFAEGDGTFTSADGGVQVLCKAVEPVVEADNISLLLQLSEQAGAPLPYRGLEDVRKAIDTQPGPASCAMKLVASKGTQLYYQAANTNELVVRLLEFTAAKGV